ncbi:MAG: hypothetical protein LN588_02945 [Rickettsia endosymbiont of Bryobia graminum]|nr:hypothetical protein [Rickettsia endosymbiont of Bryobia graminum]
MQNNISHYIGYRQRLRQRVIDSVENLADYELLELILFFVPRKDVKPLAKELLNHFGNFSSLINANKEKLLSIKGVNENLYINFVILREVINRTLKQKVINKNIISSWSILIDYLKATIGSMSLEQFRVLFLNKKIS